MPTRLEIPILKVEDTESFASRVQRIMAKTLNLSSLELLDEAEIPDEVRFTTRHSVTAIYALAPNSGYWSIGTSEKMRLEAERCLGKRHLISLLRLKCAEIPERRYLLVLWIGLSLISLDWPFFSTVQSSSVILTLL